MAAPAETRCGRYACDGLHVRVVEVRDARGELLEVRQINSLEDDLAVDALGDPGVAIAVERCEVCAPRKAPEPEPAPVAATLEDAAEEEYEEKWWNR